MHGVEEAVERLEFSLETGQGQKGQFYLIAIEKLLEFVVDVDLDESGKLVVLVVGVGADTANSFENSHIF